MYKYIKMKKINIYLTLILIIIISILTSLFLNFANKDTCLLLTTCVNVQEKYTYMYEKKMSDKNYRHEQYIEVIKKYLATTEYPIYIVESSGYTFPEFQNNKRVSIYSFNLNIVNNGYKNKTPMEAISILKIYDYYNLSKYKNIVKITGKYFIPNIDKYLNNMDKNALLYLQSIYRKENNKFTYQSSEIVGFKSELIDMFYVLSGMYDDKYSLEWKRTRKSFRIPSIEGYLSIILNNIQNNKIYRFPKMDLDKNIQRGCIDCEGKIRKYL